MNRLYFVLPLFMVAFSADAELPSSADCSRIIAGALPSEFPVWMTGYEKLFAQTQGSVFWSDWVDLKKQSSGVAQASRDGTRAFILNHETQTIRIYDLSENKFLYQKQIAFAVESAFFVHGAPQKIRIQPESIDDELPIEEVWTLNVSNQRLSFD